MFTHPSNVAAMSQFSSLAAFISSRYIVIGAAVVVVLAIVVVFIMVLRSDSGDSKTERGLAFDSDEGPSGDQYGTGRRPMMNGAADRGGSPMSSGGSPMNAGFDRAGAFGGPSSFDRAPVGAERGGMDRVSAPFGNEPMHRPGDFGGTVGGNGTPSRPQMGGPAWSGGRDESQGALGGRPDAAPWNKAMEPSPWGQPPAPEPAPWGTPPAPEPAPWGALPQEPSPWGQPPRSPSQPNQNGWGQAPSNMPQNAPGGWDQPAQAAPSNWGSPSAPPRPAAAPGGWGQPAAPEPPPSRWGAPSGPTNQPVMPPPSQPSWGAPPPPAPSQPSWGAPPMATPAPPPVQPNWGTPPPMPGGWGQEPPATRADTRLAMVVVREGKEPGRTYELRRDRLTIGRSRESDVFLEDLAVSRLHASIYRDDQGNYILRDENSANGTSVNGQRITEHRLNEGDDISVGQTTMTFTRR